MTFLPYMEISPAYEDGIFENSNGTRNISTNFSLRDGDTLYLIGGTILCKYDISDPKAPRLLKKADIAADHGSDPLLDLIRKDCAHATAMADLGKYLIISLRNNGGGIKNMGEGVVVGNLSIIDKETLEKVKELNFENKVTYIKRYKDLLIVSLHFHGFYIYKLTEDADILSCICKYIEAEKPQTASAREFQNSAVFEAEKGKINIAFASYSYGISVFTYDLESNLLSPHCELNLRIRPDMHDFETGAKNTVFGLTSKGSFVYGGISTGNSRFREKYKDVDWSKFDKRGIIYGPHDRLVEEHYHLELPDCDKPAYIGVIAGDPAPSFLCVAGDHLLFNLDRQGIGVARIEYDGKLSYIGRTLEDPEGRQLTYQLNFDGEFLYTSYRDPIPESSVSPIFRMYTIKE